MCLSQRSRLKPLKYRLQAHEVAELRVKNMPGNLNARRLLAEVEYEIMESQSDKTEILNWASRLLKTGSTALSLELPLPPSFQSHLNQRLLKAHLLKKDALIGLRRSSEAIKNCQEAIAIVQAFPADRHDEQRHRLRDLYRDQARIEKDLGRYRESAQHSTEAAKQAPPAEMSHRWKDDLNAAECRILDNDLVGGYQAARAIAAQRPPMNPDEVRQLIRIYEQRVSVMLNKAQEQESS